MLPSISSDEFINFVFYGGLLILLISIMMMVFVVLFRVWSIKRNREIQQFSQEWEAIFKNSNHALSLYSLPQVNKKYKLFLLIKLWVNVYKQSDNSQREYLLAIASELKIVPILAKMLDDKNGNFNILALRAIGYLKEGTFNSKLYMLLKHQSSFLSLLAAQSLLKISSKDAIDQLLTTYIQREDWIDKNMIYILEEVDEEILYQALIKIIKRTSTDTTPKLMQLFKLIESKKAYGEVKRLLRIHNSPEVLSVALLYMNRTEDKDKLLVYTYHPSWRVRLSAITSLKTMIMGKDINMISHLLSDKIWEIRHIMAEILVVQKFANSTYLDYLYATLVDSNAKKALIEARSKRGVKCL